MLISVRQLELPFHLAGRVPPNCELQTAVYQNFFDLKAMQTASVELKAFNYFPREEPTQTLEKRFKIVQIANNEYELLGVNLRIIGDSFIAE